jgi:uncharacterized protein YgiM (DUF1202 family)
MGYVSDCLKGAAISSMLCQIPGVRFLFKCGCLIVVVLFAMLCVAPSACVAIGDTVFDADGYNAEQEALAEEEAIVVEEQFVEEEVLGSWDNGIYGIVTVTSLNVRSGASIDSELIGQIPYDTPVVILEMTENWFKIVYEDGFGYVYRIYVSMEVDDGC